MFESVFVAVWFGLLQSSYTVLLQCKMSLPPTWRAGRPVPQIMSDSTLPPTRLLPPSSPTSEQFEEDTTQAFPQSSRGACLNDAEEGEYVCFGKDFKPFLPHTLGLSIVTGAAFMTFAAIPMLCSIQSVAPSPLIAVELGLNAIGLGLMLYCGYSDPGQRKKTRDLELGHSGEDNESGSGPKRSHKSFQYNRRIRRYDHFCKWVNNVT